MHCMEVYDAMDHSEIHFFNVLNFLTKFTVSFNTLASDCCKEHKISCIKDYRNMTRHRSWSKIFINPINFQKVPKKFRTLYLQNLRELFLRVVSLNLLFCSLEIFLVNFFLFANIFVADDGGTSWDLDSNRLAMKKKRQNICKKILFSKQLGLQNSNMTI